MSDVSASFEETNRMREKLGLQPLARPNKESVSAARDAAAREAEQAAREAEDEQLRQELAKRKEQRLKNAVVEGKTLGETLAKQTAGSALDWVNRSRKVTDQERLKAEQRARLIAEQEQQMAEYTSSDVAHLKVLHDSDQFAEGSTTILTLKDSRILKGVDQENDEEDELENVHLVDSEIVARNAERKKKKPTYDVYNEDAVLLGKYDEEKSKKDGIRLGELTGTYDIDSTTQNARVRNNLAKIEGTGTRYDLHSELKVASDYKEVKFKGKKKKEKTVQRKRPMIDDDEETPTTTDESKFVLPEPSPEERAQDHAKRSAASEKPDWMTSTQEQVKKSQDLRDQSYLRALQKAELATAQLKSTYYNKSTQPPPVITEDDDDAIVLQEALARARRMAVKKEEKDATLKLAEQVRADQQAKDKVKQEEEDSIRVKLEASDDSMTDDTPAPEPTTISLSTTTEFCRGLDLDTDIRVKREKQDEKQEEPVKIETRKENDEMDVDEKQDEKTTIKEEDETKEDDEEVLASVLDDEPTADQSVTGALELFRKRAMFESGFSEQVGRRKDKVLDIGVDASTLPLIRVDDEGRALKPKEAFRQLSHKFHGQKPGFKKREKEQKRHAEEQRKRAMMMDATHSTGVSGKLMEAQKSSGQAYLVLDKGIRQQLEKTAKAKKEGDAEHAKNAKRKASIMDETVDRPRNTSSSTSSSTSKGINHVVGDIRTKVSVQLKAEPSKKRRIAASEFAGADDEDETEQQ